jgi:hypothetical protein
VTFLAAAALILASSGATSPPEDVPERSDVVVEAAARYLHEVFCKRAQCYLTLTGKAPPERLASRLRDLENTHLIPPPEATGGLRDSVTFHVDVRSVKFLNDGRASVSAKVASGGRTVQSCVHSLTIVEGRWQVREAEGTCDVL